MRLILHDGVMLTGRLLHDQATGRRVALPSDADSDGPDTVAFVVQQGFGAVVCGLLDLPIVWKACWRQSSIKPAMRCMRRVRRYCPPTGARFVLLYGLRAATGPALWFAGALMIVAVVAGALVGEALQPLQAVLFGAPTWWVTLAMHEITHLALLRAIGDQRKVTPTAGAYEVAGPRIAVIGPPLPPRQARLVALGGPVAGAAGAAIAFGLGMIPAWLTVAVALAHVLNLVPMAADGRALWGD